MWLLIESRQLLLSDAPAGFFHKAEESRDSVLAKGRLEVCLCVPRITHVDASDVLEWIVGSISLGIRSEST